MTPTESKKTPSEATPPLKTIVRVLSADEERSTESGIESAVELHAEDRYVIGRCLVDELSSCSSSSPPTTIESRSSGMRLREQNRTTATTMTEHFSLPHYHSYPSFFSPEQKNNSPPRTASCCGDVKAAPCK
jgi:hypothetical protein